MMNLEYIVVTKKKPGEELCYLGPRIWDNNMGKSIENEGVARAAGSNGWGPTNEGAQSSRTG